MDIVRLTIITPAKRIKNLHRVYESIFSNCPVNMKLVWQLIIDYDEKVFITEYGKNTLNSLYEFDRTAITFLPSADLGLSGNPQRNEALESVHTGFVCFMDDDNIMHPDYKLAVLYSMLNNPHTGIIVNQIFQNGNSRLRSNPNNVKPGHIDTAQFTLPIDIIGDVRWDNWDYCADGHFIERVYNNNKEKFVFLDSDLCYYNYLR